MEGQTILWMFVFYGFYFAVLAYLLAPVFKTTK